MFGDLLLLSTVAYKCVLLLNLERDISQVLQRRKDSRRSSRKSFNSPRSTSVLWQLRLCLAGHTLMSKQVPHAVSLDNLKPSRNVGRSNSLSADCNPSISELHLDVLTNVIDAADMDCQTDPSLDKPTSPLFKFAKTGKDFGSRIEEAQVCDSNKTSGCKKMLSRSNIYYKIISSPFRHSTLSHLTLGLELL